jgi:hypothetical protein
MFRMLSPVTKLMPGHLIMIFPFIEPPNLLFCLQNPTEPNSSPDESSSRVLWLQNVSNKIRGISNTRNKAPTMPNPAMNHGLVPVPSILYPYTLRCNLSLCRVSSNSVLCLHVLYCILTFRIVS